MGTPSDEDMAREQEPGERADSGPAEAPEAAGGEADQTDAGAAAEPTAGEAADATATAGQERPSAPPKARQSRTTAAKTGGTRTRAPRVVADAEPAPAPPARSRVVATDLPKDIFDARVNVPLIHQVVVAQQAAARQGTHATKTRGQVRGGGKKPYRQKGTGRARQGSIRAPQFAGGGVVGGPVPRSYAQKTPKKMKGAALRGALSDRARHGLIQVVDGFVDDEPKTRDALSVLTTATGVAAGAASVLVVADRSDQLTWKSLRNASGVHLIDPGQLNTYDVLVSDRVVFTQAALASFVARAGTEGGGAGQEDEQR